MKGKGRLYILIALLAAVGAGSYVARDFIEEGLSGTFQNATATIININQFIERRQTERQLQRESPDDRLLMPVVGVRVENVADTWHHPRGNRLHEGQDIFAPQGRVIRSATDGIVRRIGVGTLGGNYIFITGAGGRRYYYAHLDQISPVLRENDEVKKETIIGFVGNTGNAESTSPHLHFGVYTNQGPIDPLPLLINREE